MQPLALAFSSVRNLKEDTLGQIKSKADRLQELRQDPVFNLSRWGSGSSYGRLPAAQNRRCPHQSRKLHGAHQ